jgi:hypothetical protein
MIKPERLQASAASQQRWRYGWARYVGAAVTGTVFGLYRLWIAGIELCPTVFYYQSLDDLRAQRIDDLSNVEPTIDSLNLKPKWWWANVL